MIIGKIEKNEKRVKFQLKLHCSKCGKKVPGVLQSSKRYYESKEFKNELEEFKQNYLCGICRDKIRIKEKKG